MVVYKIVEHVDELVLTQGELLGLTIRVLDNVGEFAQQNLAGFLNQPIPAEIPQCGAVRARSPTATRV